MCFRCGLAGKQFDASSDGFDRRTKHHLGGLGAEDQRQLLGAALEFVERRGKESLIFARTLRRVAAGEAIVLQGASAISLLLNDHLVNQAARFHASQRQQPICPRIRRVSHELANRILALLSGLDAAFDKGLDHAARLIVRWRQLELFNRKRDFGANADLGQAIFQVAAPPSSSVVVTFELMSEVEHQRFQNGPPWSFHHSSSTSKSRKSASMRSSSSRATCCHSSGTRTVFSGARSDKRTRLSWRSGFGSLPLPPPFARRA